MSVNSHDIQSTSVSRSPLSALAGAAESKSKSTQDAVSGSFATVLNESRLQMRAKLQQQENVSPQQMFEKPIAADSRQPESSQRNESVAKNNTNKNDALSRNSKWLASDHSRLNLQSRVSQSNFSNTNSGQPPTSNLDPNLNHDGSSQSDRIGSGHGDAESGQTTNKPAFQHAQLQDNLSDRRSESWTEAGVAQSNYVPTLDAAKPTASSSTNLAEDLGQWLKSQLKQEISGVSADKLIIAPPTRSSSNPFGEAAKSAPPDTQPAQPQVDEEPELETSSRAIFNQLVRSMRVRHDAQSSSAQIELDPPRLGPMRVDIRMEGDQLRMEVQTTNEEARDLLHSKLADLKAALQNQGIKLDDVSVFVTKSLTPLGESIATQNQGQASLSRYSTNQPTPNRTDSRGSTKRPARDASDRASNDASELFAASN